MNHNEFLDCKIALVIPYYKAAASILNVVRSIPSFVHMLIIIDDQSPEDLPKQQIMDIIPSSLHRVFLENPLNLGVGGASKKGFEYAIAYGMDIVIKVDADEQMDLNYLPEMIRAIIDGGADAAKGNRFRDFKSLQRMPPVRRMGNLILSFLIKFATGYWNNFDPTNGYWAIKTNTLKKIDFAKLSNRYYFETSLLAECYFQQAVIKDIAMPAIYGNEKSNMNLWTMPFVFGRKLTATLIKRIAKSYFLYDFNIGSIYILFGLPLFLFGLIFGIYVWIHYASVNVLTPTGTIMIVTLSIILGFQLLLQAIQYDIINAPKAGR